jgi:hypothetical protein
MSRHDTQELVAAGIFPIATEGDSTQYKKVREVPTFAQYNPGAVKRYKKDFMSYAKFIEGIELGNTPAGKERTGFVASDLEFEQSGRPRVPDPIRNINGIETSATKQQIIRVYLTRHYSKSRQIYCLINPIFTRQQISPRARMGLFPSRPSFHPGKII